MSTGNLLDKVGNKKPSATRRSTPQSRVKRSILKFKQKFENSFRLLPALRLVWQSSRGWTVARVVLTLMQGILPLISIYLAKLIIDTVAVSLSAADKDAAFDRVLLFLGIAGAIAILTTFCNACTELVNTAHAQRVTDFMQGIIHAKSIEADLAYYENARYYDALQRAQKEAPYRPPQILNRLAGVGQNGVLLLAMVGLLLSLHWGMVGILVVASIPAMLVRVRYSRVMYRWQRDKTSMERQSAYLGWMLTTDRFAKEIRLFELGTFFSKWYLRLRKQIYQERVALTTKQSIANFLAQSLASLLVFSIYIFIIYQTIQGALNLGDLVLYYQALNKSQAALKGLLKGVSGLYEDNLFLANLYDFLDLKPTIIAPAQPQPIPQPMQHGIVFENVSFQYPTTNRTALKNINLTVSPGETIALVGENGSGKTTLITLLCRLYEPTEGNISIDGINVDRFDISELRHQISVIFQDYAKYHLSARDNIWLGNVELEREDEEIMAAARRSGADDVIQKLPQEYETLLGKLFENGEELSIGQWQKIALARAFLRNSQAIVLDEPTSAMDPKAEYEVFNKFRQLIKDQAAILITHRLSTVKMADRIYVMDSGSIIESGTHDELIELNGTYARLFETQAQNYR
ncbi:ABC transporter ATP-binding protein [Oscillatoriales cyanobacterium LEGE 11467]|uniref:ABC transporter ATP-binding protein n=1 Tax=Zarconia navalis LEGE 11467 TaxID=1828826 RepID=A0A928Z935_9CYAN|nr:ABC transporter ATP-binding protein [Zarconia navalis]MBE9041274.1 ABC transporter ATP-binding protein [Zarconia navalis LEGE 11467]